MRVLLAHQSLLRLAQAKQEIALAIADADMLESATLTDAYHLAEHYAPDCALFSEELADLPEFELVTSLLRIMNISCFILSTNFGTPRRHPVYDDIRIVPEIALKDIIQQSDHRLGQTDQTSDVGVASVAETDTYDQGRLILVGASTGGIDALLNVSRCFNEHSPPMLIVQHTGGRFARSLIRLLDGASTATVMAAEDGMSPEQGYIYLAPDDQAHLTIAPGRIRTMALRRGATVSGHRPSVDALFTSAVPCASKVSAALLTGMGKDGAAGLTKLHRGGAFTIGQDQQTSVVYGMPRVAMEMGAVRKQLPIQQIGPALLASCKLKQRA